MKRQVARGFLLAGLVSLHAQALCTLHAAVLLRTAAFLVSALLWGALIGTPRWWARLGALLWMVCSLGVALTVALLGRVPSSDTLWMLCSSPPYTAHLLRHVGPVGLYVAVLLGAGMFATWVLHVSAWRVPQWVWPVGLLCAFGLLHTSAPVPADLTVLRLASQMWIERSVRAEREPPAAAARVLPPRALSDGANGQQAVVWIIHESLRSDAPKPRLPGARSYVYFANAYAQSTQTPVSVPSMLTGLAPDDSRAHFASAPLAWHHFDPGGEASVFVSPQLFSWSNLLRFYFDDKPPSFVRTAESLRGTPVNDGGVADSEAVDAALDLADRVWSTRGELFLFVQFNAAHLPCWHPGVAPESAHYEASPERDARCHEAAAYERREEARLLEGLASRGSLQHAWIVSTSDHAEVADGEAPGRAYDVRAGLAHVPMWISPPADWCALHVTACTQLAANASRVVGNADLLPTLLDAQGLPAAAGAAGHSLLRAVPAERAVRACIGVPLRAWDNSVCTEFH